MFCSFKLLIFYVVIYIHVRALSMLCLKQKHALHVIEHQL